MIEKLKIILSFNDDYFEDLKEYLDNKIGINNILWSDKK